MNTILVTSTNRIIELLKGSDIGKNLNKGDSYLANGWGVVIGAKEYDAVTDTYILEVGQQITIPEGTLYECWVENGETGFCTDHELIRAKDAGEAEEKFYRMHSETGFDDDRFISVPLEKKICKTEFEVNFIDEWGKSKCLAAIKTKEPKTEADVLQEIENFVELLTRYSRSGCRRDLEGDQILNSLCEDRDWEWRYVAKEREDMITIELS